PERTSRDRGGSAGKRALFGASAMRSRVSPRVPRTHLGGSVDLRHVPGAGREGALLARARGGRRPPAPHLPRTGRAGSRTERNEPHDPSATSGQQQRLPPPQGNRQLAIGRPREGGPRSRQGRAPAGTEQRSPKT